MIVPNVSARCASGTLALLLSSCAVGPDFVRPAAPEVTRYTQTPLSATASTANVVGGESQRFIDGQDIPAGWWELYGSPALNGLVERALKANPDLRAAEAALAVAHENTLAQRGAYFPTVSASLASPTSLGSTAGWSSPSAPRNSRRTSSVPLPTSP